MLFAPTLAVKVLSALKVKDICPSLIPTFANCSFNLLSAAPAATEPPAFCSKLSDSNSMAEPVYIHVPFMLAVYFAATRMEVLLNSFSRFALDLLSSPNGEMKAIFGSLIGVSAVEIVIDAVLWLITQTILTRKLNLP